MEEAITRLADIAMALVIYAMMALPIVAAIIWLYGWKVNRERRQRYGEAKQRHDTFVARVEADMEQQRRRMHHD